MTAWRAQTAFLPAAAAVLLAGAWCAAPARADDIEQGLVEVLVTYQEHDPVLPWQKRRPDTRAGYGVVTDASTVLTTESLVRNATLVEVRRAGSGEKIAASALISDCRLDCALLRLAATPSGAPLRPVPLAGRVPPAAEVEIVQFDATRRLQRGKGRVIQVAVKDLPYAPYPSLTFDILTDLDVRGGGAPVLFEGKLAGLMMKYDSGTRSGVMAPCETLRRFKDDAGQPPYEGVASAGFMWQELVDPAKRAYLGVSGETGGVQVVSCLPGRGAAEALRAGDVILRWDSFDVDALGFYEDPEYGRLALPYLILGRRRPGETVPAVVVRGGRKIETQVRLARWSDDDALIPENIEGRREEYIVEGGLILRELTAAYFRAFGGDWQRRVDPRLAHLYVTRRHAPERPGDRVVLLSGVLPDAINIGYEGFRDAIVTKVNGRPVRNLRDVFAAAERDGCVSRVTLRSVGADLVLDRDELGAANARLAKQYRIPERAYRRAPAAEGKEKTP